MRWSLSTTTFRFRRRLNRIGRQEWTLNGSFLTDLDQLSATKRKGHLSALFHGLSPSPDGRSFFDSLQSDDLPTDFNKVVPSEFVAMDFCCSCPRVSDQQDTVADGKGSCPSRASPSDDLHERRIGHTSISSPDSYIIIENIAKLPTAFQSMFLMFLYHGSIPSTAGLDGRSGDILPRALRRASETADEG